MAVAASSCQFPLGHRWHGIICRGEGLLARTLPASEPTTIGSGAGVTAAPTTGRVAMKNFTIAARASDPAERTRVIQNVRAIVDRLEGVRLRLQGADLEAAFGTPPQALPIEANEAGLTALKNAVGNDVAIEPDLPLRF